MTLPQWTREELDRDRLVISDEDLAERLSRVTPLLLRNGELYRFKELPHPRKIAFTWGPEDDNLVLVQERYDDKTYNVIDWFIEVSRGQTHHSCGYHGFVKPTIAEVLAQLPDDPKITAFYLDIDSTRILYDGEGHIINVFWLTNLPETIEEKAERFARRHPGEENIYA